MLSIYSWLLKIFYAITLKFRRSKIDIYRSVLSGNGSFIDIRYQLTRPDKFKGTFPIYLINEKTNERLYLMRLAKFGTVKTKHQKYQTSGILLFRNNDYLIKAGDTVTLIFGNLYKQNIRIN